MRRTHANGRVAAGLGLILAAACTWDGPPADLVYACPDERCPDGQVCHEGLCVTDPGGDDGGPPGSCPGETRFADDFAVALDPVRWTVVEQGATATVVDGALEIAYQDRDQRASVRMVDRFELDGSRITIEVAAPPNLTSGNMVLTLFDDAPEVPQLTIKVDNTDFFAQVRPDTGPGFDVPTRDYRPQDDRFWRIRRGGGQICFDTSPSADDADFVEFGCGSDEGIRRELRVEIGAANYQNEPQVVRFDDLAWCVD